MENFDPVYKFDGDSVTVIHNNRVIASGKTSDIKEVESDALAYLEGLEHEENERKRKSATHIVTPNGVRGKILNRLTDVWGDTSVSVRFDNGQTATLRTAGVTFVTEVTKIASAPSGLESRLSSSFNHDRTSLVVRLEELDEIKKEAVKLIQAGTSYIDEQKLDNIRVVADAESAGIREAIEAIDSEAVEPYSAPRPQVVPQADLGNQVGGDWLDVMVGDMVAESESHDLDKELEEGPELLAAEFEDEVVNNQEVAREMALSHIISVTAGYEGEDLERYRDSFLARFEQARRRQVTARNLNTRKEAAAIQSRVVDAPDAALFG